MEIFNINNLEKYKNSKENGIKFFADGGYLLFFKNQLLGYKLTLFKRKEVINIAHSKDWEEFKKQVEEWCYENK